MADSENIVKGFVLIKLHRWWRSLDRSHDHSLGRSFGGSFAHSSIRSRGRSLTRSVARLEFEQSHAPHRHCILDDLKARHERFLTRTIAQIGPKAPPPNVNFNALTTNDVVPGASGVVVPAKPASTIILVVPPAGATNVSWLGTGGISNASTTASTSDWPRGRLGAKASLAAGPPKKAPPPLRA